MPEQSDWRYCQKCHVLFYNGFNDKGRCQTGGGHNAQGFNLILPYGAPATASSQDKWRHCEKCRGLFYDGYGDKGKCPAGGGHTAQGIVFTLVHSMAGTSSAQADWRYCQKCHAMFYDGYGDKGKCTAGGGHSAQGLNFNLSHSAAAGWVTTPVDLKWMGTPIPVLATLALDQFGVGFRNGAASQIPDPWITDLITKITADPNGFKLGYATGVLSGLVAGLKSLFSTIVDLFKLVLSLSPPVLAMRAVNEAFYLITDPAQRELRKRQIEEAQRIARAAQATIDDINQNPGDYIVLSGEVGEALGRSAGEWFTEDFLQKSALEIGQVVGSVVGQVAFEIMLQIVLELTTAGVGNATRGVIAVGQGAKGGSRVARLVEMLKPLLRRTKGLQKFVRELMRDERGALLLGGKKPIPKGMLSKTHEPPWGLKMKDPFTGTEHGVTARAGVSESSKANPARAMRTGIDASAAEFESFKIAVFERGEIGIQSAGHANAPGVDFVTAARRADGQMEIILNDATVNLQKKAKTVPPSRWLEEAEAAIKRMDLPDPVLTAEINDALEAKRFRIRTLTINTTPTGITVVGW